MFLGGLVVENMGHEPVTVYSRDEFKRQMIAHGCEQKIKYVPGDKYLTNWALGIDAQTLANAAVLVSRGHATVEDPGRLNSVQAEVRALHGERIVERVIRRRAK